MKFSKQFYNVPWIVLILLVSLLSACSADVSSSTSQNLASLSLQVGLGSKALSSEVQDASLSYRYNVVHASDSGTEVPESQWKSLVLTGGKGTIENLKPGDCTISVSAWSGSTKLYSGSSSVLLVSGSENNIVIQLESVGASGNGTLDVRINAKCDTVFASYTNVNTGDSSTIDLSSSSATSDGVRAFTAKKTLPSGSYEIAFTMFKDGVQCGGEVVAFQVDPCGTAVVSGTLEDGLDSVVGADIATTSTMLLKQGVSQTFVYKSNGVPANCVWTLNNNVVAEGSTFVFDVPMTGQHTLECTVGSKTYKCVITCYMHETLSVSFEEILDLAGNSSGIYSDIIITATGESVLDQDPKTYTYTLKYTTFDKPTSLADIGAKAVDAPSSLMKAEMLVIGKNASLSSSINQGWVGQEVEEDSNEALRGVFVYCNIPDYALYGCTNLDTVWLGDTVTSVGKYAFGGAGRHSKNNFDRCPSSTVFDATAFEDL